ncbi:uncharacterized protein LOC113213763 isoform X2 [Frankliniella occidentalis]|uniref:Uncharacterized protein LOC113213763 isoform X2 n=1 Tax=Frankliniella occidentalis TaxID=133901 RepID=A0A6J1TAK4_FRAOC|nr:uncharacterized protein LOC113213763 isoform X2 [Frankliniella occidentalis]
MNPSAMENTSLSSSPEKKKMKMESPGGMAAIAGGSQEVEIKEEQEPKEEEGERKCSPEDRKEWKAYRDSNSGRTKKIVQEGNSNTHVSVDVQVFDPAVADDENKRHARMLASAIKLVNHRYKPLDRVTSNNPYSPQGMRHNAELKFFDIRDKSVRDLMRDVTKHQYRNPKDTKKPKPIDLTGKSARYVIAAERLRQETLITLCTGDIISSEIPYARTHPWMGRELGLGPEETYEAKFEGPGLKEVTEQVVSEHRMEISDNEPPPLSLAIHLLDASIINTTKSSVF